VAVDIFRKENLTQLNVYKGAAQVDELVSLLRDRWAFLREQGWASDRPVVVTKAGDVVAEVFAWTSEEAKAKAAKAPRVRRLEDRIAALVSRELVSRAGTEAIRGFQKNFPVTGGVEFLQGVCSCHLDIEGVGKGIVVRAIDGVVLMHRSPRADFDGDGKTEMFLHINYHACSLDIAQLGPTRIEQNFDVPNDGIVKSHGKGRNDFPGTAIWRVAWKFQTERGVLVTDPTKPLVFGPGTVSHYPPVGTEFRSPTGPVALLHEETGKQVGTLTPEELTAFDILATRDDEFDDPILNNPPPDVFELLARYTKEG